MPMITETTISFRNRLSGDCGIGAGLL